MVFPSGSKSSPAASCVGSPLKVKHSWWIRRAAAHRDGIIDGSPHGITADKDGAYAILMTGEEELETGTDNLVKYRTSKFDPGCFKLMENLSSRQVVRVLRSWRMSSKWKPKAGLRYDGL